MYKYICSECSKEKQFSSTNMHYQTCDCGGNFNLKLEDHFDEYSYKCFVCKNKNTELCLTCKWNYEVEE